MNLFKHFFTYERENYAMDWRRLLIQGLLIVLAGLMLATASALNPAAMIMNARNLSWLPVSGIIVVTLGLLECLDAALAKETRDFLQNLQVGVLDVVIGGLIILSIGEEAAHFSLMIAAFLIVRGIVRVTLVYALRLPHTLSTSLGGLLSVLMGFYIVLGWQPSTEGWFLSICLNIEIASRGWAIITFALWLRMHKEEEFDY